MYLHTVIDVYRLILNVLKRNTKKKLYSTIGTNTSYFKNILNNVSPFTLTDAILHWVNNWKRYLSIH